MVCFFTKTAVFFHFDPVRIILLVLHGVIISLLALCACHVILVRMAIPPTSCIGAI